MNIVSQKWNPTTLNAAAAPLRPDELRLLEIDLSAAPITFQDLLQILSKSERDKHLRYRRSQDKIRFLAGRGILRLVLGGLLDRAPQSLIFEYNAYGKPSLSLDRHTPPIEFNVSHSGDLVLIAFAIENPIGVDVEKIAALEEMSEIAQMLFTPDEIDKLEKLKTDAKTRFFYQTWTRHEARLKALGTGIGGSKKEQAASKIKLANLRLPKGYKGAVARIIE